MYNRSYFNLYVNSTLPLNQYLCHWDSLEEDQCPWSHNHLNYVTENYWRDTESGLRQETDKKKLGHVKQTDICHYMVYSNIIPNLSISTCYMVNHTCDFKSKLAVCARSILKSCIWFWTKVALSSILPLYMCLSFLLSISHSLLRSLSQYVIKGCKGTELELSLRAVCNTCYGWANLMLGMIKLKS